MVDRTFAQPAGRAIHRLPQSVRESSCGPCRRLIGRSEHRDAGNSASRRNMHRAGIVRQTQAARRGHIDELAQRRVSRPPDSFRHKPRTQPHRKASARIQNRTQQRKRRVPPRSHEPPPQNDPATIASLRHTPHPDSPQSPAAQFHAPRTKLPHANAAIPRAHRKESRLRLMATEQSIPRAAAAPDSSNAHAAESRPPPEPRSHSSAKGRAHRAHIPPGAAPARATQSPRSQTNSAAEPQGRILPAAVRFPVAT